RGVIPPEKIHGYLLSAVHPVGRHKAAFFRSLGYAQRDWGALERDLRTFLHGDAEEMERTDYEAKYEIRGTVTGPNGRSAAIVTAWIVLHDSDVARFVTAYPED